MSGSINVEDLERLESVVKANNNLSRALDKPYVFPLARKRISKIFSMLSKEERMLFISLISRYEIHNDYGEMSFNLIEDMKYAVDKFGKIVLSTPYIDSPREQKSAGVIIYELRAQLVSIGVDRRLVEIHDIVTSSPVKYPIFIVDDFSGSGSTIGDALEKLTNIGQSIDLIRVSVFYAMEAALQKFADAGVKARTVYSGKPCISEYAYEGDLMGVDVGAIYDGIEGRLGVNELNRRGYAQSEALVSMKRTPNNTLPIFWFSGKKGVSWPCPFPR